MTYSSTGLHRSLCCGQTVSRWVPAGDTPGPWECDNCGKSCEHTYTYTTPYRDRAVVFVVPRGSAWAACQYTHRGRGDFDVRGLRILATSYGVACAIARAIEEEI